MPGSIKIDDGSGNYTILTNAGSLGSDKTITIPNETATLATTTATDLGGLIKLASATPSGASEIQFANFVDNSTYSKYKIILEEVIADTDAAILYFTFLDASDADVSGTYKKSGYYAYMDTTGHSFLGNSTSSGFGRTAFNFGNVSEENFTCEIDFYPNNTKNIAKINNRYIGEWSGGTYLKSDEAYTLDTSTAIKGIRYYMSTGNISATKATLYGVKK